MHQVRSARLETSIVLYDVAVGIKQSVGVRALGRWLLCQRDVQRVLIGHRQAAH